MINSFVVCCWFDKLVLYNYTPGALFVFCDFKNKLLVHTPATNILCKEGRIIYVQNKLCRKVD